MHRRRDARYEPVQPTAVDAGPDAGPLAGLCARLQDAVGNHALAQMLLGDDPSGLKDVVVDQFVSAAAGRSEVDPFGSNAEMQRRLARPPRPAT